jgi:hypothetical protein
VVEEDRPRRSEGVATSGPADGSGAGDLAHVERRLAAILSADVKDYSRLMGDALKVILAAEEEAARA